MPVRKHPAAATVSWSHQLRAVLPIVVLCVLAGCATQRGGHYAYRFHTRPTHYYPPPGPPNDPWGPYIQQAAARFGVPELWIREVMRQESGGDETAVSSAGAMGLMQVIPSTYETLREQYGLGDDPFNPSDNIMAGAAYIREMYDRYGSPGFLAAYNAGPQRVDDYLASGDPLPDETVNYVALIAPRIAGATPETGPFAVYGNQGGVQYAAAAGGTGVATAGDCDPDAAYDPTRPCAPAPTVAVAVNATTAVPAPSVPAAGQSLIYDPNAAYARGAPQQAAEACDPDAAYDPARPCAPAPTLAVATSATPLPPTMPVATLAVSSTSGGGNWAIQVGAFRSPDSARAAAQSARRAAPGLLRAARLDLPLTEPFGTTVLYRARLADLSARAASEACAVLMQQQLACVVVAPDHG